jgi:hypothetical protein
VVLSEICLVLSAICVVCEICLVCEFVRTVPSHSWPAKRDSPVSEISLCSYFYSKNHRAFIWTSGLARLPRSRLKEARSRLPGWKFLHINTHKRASPVARMKVQR